MISIVIPCLNELDFIDQTLNSLIDQQDPGVSWEVIVVDGGSDDGTREILTKWAGDEDKIRWIENPQKTTPCALNLGIIDSKGDTIIILGAHSEVNADFLIRNAEALRAHPESGCVGGIVEQIHGTETSRRIGTAMSTPFGVGDARFRTGGIAGHVDTVAFGAYRRVVFDEIGLFDEALTRNQDDEFNFRLLQSGWRIWFDPRIRSRYFVRSSYSRLMRQYHQYGYWKVFVNRKHGTITTWRQIVPATFIVFLSLTLMTWGLEVSGQWDDAWSGLGASLFISALSFWLVIGSGSAIASAGSFRDVPGILKAYALIHLGYGWGYLKGILDFIFLRSHPNKEAGKLTR